jgi:Uma2 family endonuclease
LAALEVPTILAISDSSFLTGFVIDYLEQISVRRDVMASQPKTTYTPDAYLEIDRQSAFKNEFVDGQIFAMTGASRKHNLITSNVNYSLNLQLKGRKCEVYASDMRVRVSSSGLYTYPDVVVVCGPPIFEDKESDTLTNPAVLIEVLSKSTEAYDRGEKSGRYRKLDSLSEYILISQEKPHIEHFVRQPDNHWLLSEAYDLQAEIDLISIGCKLAMTDVYDKVEWSLD